MCPQFGIAEKGMFDSYYWIKWLNNCSRRLTGSQHMHSKKRVRLSSKYNQPIPDKVLKSSENQISMFYIIFVHFWFLLYSSLSLNLVVINFMYLLLLQFAMQYKFNNELIICAFSKKYIIIELKCLIIRRKKKNLSKCIIF